MKELAEHVARIVSIYESMEGVHIRNRYTLHRVSNTF